MIPVNGSEATFVYSLFTSPAWTVERCTAGGVNNHSFNTFIFDGACLRNELNRQYTAVDISICYFRGLELEETDAVPVRGEILARGLSAQSAPFPWQRQHLSCNTF